MYEYGSKTSGIWAEILKVTVRGTFDAPAEKTLSLSLPRLAPRKEGFPAMEGLSTDQHHLASRVVSTAVTYVAYLTMCVYMDSITEPKSLMVCTNEAFHSCWPANLSWSRITYLSLFRLCAPKNQPCPVPLRAVAPSE